MFKKIVRLIKRFSSLIIVLLAGAICAGSITAGALYIRSMTNALWEQIVSDVTEITAQGAHSFETFLQKEIDSIDTLTKNMEIFDYTDDADMKNAFNLFDMYSEEDGYFALIIFDEPQPKQCKVHLALSNEEKAAGKERTVTVVSEDYFKDYGESGISNAYYNTYTGQKSIAYYRKFTFKDGTKALIRKGQVLTDISKKFSLSFYEDTGFSYITKSDGEIILRSDNINSNRTSKNIFKFLGEGENSKSEMNKLAAAMAEGKGGAMLSTTGDKDRVLSFIPVNHTDGWYMISVIPNEAIAGNVDSIIKSSLALTVIIVAVVVLFVLFGLMTYFFRRRIVSKEAEVKYREQLFGILANNTDDVFVMTAHGSNTAEYISPNIHRVLGIEESEAKKDLNFLGKDGETFKGKYGGIDTLKSLGEDRAISFDSEREHLITGETKYFHETAYHASIEGKEKDIIVLSDRTAERLAETALKDAMDAANQANQAKSAFLSSMSHDIRTPMNAIVGMTNIANKHIDDKERVKDCLNKIAMSSSHLLTLINDVLDISKIESGKLNLSPAVFSLRDSVTNLVNIVRPQIAEKSLQFEVHINGVTHEYLYADVLRVNQIFINILSNAVKYTPEGGKITLELNQTALDDGNVRITYIVKDTGIGMSKEYMKTMYDTFSRAQDSRTNTIQGTGLGLAIVKQMITLMGGTIDCESEINKGTTFTIVLDMPIGEVEQKNMKLPPIKVLAVDDDEIFLECIQDMMSDMGVTVDTATSGKQAIKIVKERGKEYAVIIVDWKMPDMGGLETIQHIRKIISKDTLIILVSAYDWEDIESEAAMHGVDGFISKPLFRSHIYEKLCAALNLTEEEGVSEGDKGNELSGLKILVAEDNDLNWEVASTLLDVYGMSCVRAENGQRCVEMMEKAVDGEFDLILMDVQMPVMNGKEATRAIRASKRDYVKNIPILAMTADAFAEDIASCIEAGMNGHLAKPIDMDKLIQAIRGVIKKK